MKSKIGGWSLALRGWWVVEVSIGCDTENPSQPEEQCKEGVESLAS